MNFFEQNLGALLLTLEILYCSFDRSFDDVVSEYYASLGFFCEVFRQSQRLGNAALAFLVGVVDMFQSKFFAVGQQTKEIA